MVVGRATGEICKVGSVAGSGLRPRRPRCTSDDLPSFCGPPYRVMKIVGSFGIQRLSRSVRPIIVCCRSTDVNKVCAIATSCGRRGGTGIVSFLHHLCRRSAKEASFRCALVRSRLRGVCHRSHRIIGVCALFTKVTVFVSSLKLLSVSLFSVQRHCHRVNLHGIGNTRTGSVCPLLVGGCLSIVKITALLSVPLS